VVADAPMSLSAGEAAARPVLADLRVAVLGRSRSELLLAKLLRDQGAIVTLLAGTPGTPGTSATPGSPDAPGGAAADIVVDAEVAGAEAGVGTISRAAAAAVVARGGIYCLFTGLPPAAPRAVPPDREALVAAELGLNRCGDPAQDPDPEPLGVTSGYAAIWAAIYLTAALRIRSGAGRGARIDVPLLSAAVSVIGRNLVSLDRPELIDPLSLPRLPISDIYECRDGRFVQSHGTFGHFAEILCRVIGRPEWAASAAAGVTSLSSPDEVARWRGRFAAAFLERDAAEWERVLNQAGGACTMCRTHEEWRREPEVAAAGIVTAAPQAPGSGLTGPAVTITAEPPHRGSGLGPADDRRPAWPALADELRRPGPLSGLRVLDFCIILAGPTCGRTLAELGADVIKIDSPRRGVSSYGWLDVNRGKRSMLIDLKTPAGVSLARELVADADVVLENFRAGKLAELGLGYDTLREIRPGIICGSMNAFDYGSDWAPRAGWEHNAQAGSGMQVARARDGRPRAVPVPVNDYATGLLAALGVLLAVLRRDRSGAPAHVQASLARTATYLQLGSFAGEASLGRRPDASRSLRTADGWVRTEAAGLADTAGLAGADVSDRASADVAGLLRDQGALAAIERTPRDLLGEDWARAAGLIVAWDHPRWGPLRQGMARLKASEFETSPRWPAPDPGEHTEEILRQLGRSPADIAQLTEAGTVASRRPLFPLAD
jgi:crotonobetainyl-CoA:carnitine CoA-transferase CaiB-like acyl-CoA transferase